MDLFTALLKRLFCFLFAAPAAVVHSAVSRPAWVCSLAKQRVVWVRDKSGSMEGEKARHASEACQALLNELANPANKDGFVVGVVDFNEQAEIVHPFALASQWVGKLAPINPGGYTNVTSGLEQGWSMLEQAESSDGSGVVYLRPVVIVFSDGCHNRGERPETIADKINDKVDLVTVAYGTDADEALLRSLALTPQHFYRCRDGKELRAFLKSVGPTIAKTRAAGANATQALGSMQR